MKLNRLCSAGGSVLISGAIAAAILAIVTAGILTYLTNENALTYRSHTWAHALHLAEAGAEAGFAELNYQFYIGGNGFQSSNGWSAVVANTTYTKSVTNFTDTNGRVIGNFTVTVTGINSVNPLLESVSTCSNPFHGASVSRAVRVTLTRSSRFPVSLMSKNKMDLNGNNVYVDSYDSTDPSKSTGGLYDPAEKQANGNVASNGTVTNTVSVGNADIYGVTYTGTGGSVSLGPSGSIGPTFVSGDRATTVGAAQSQGWIQSDFNVYVPDVILPSGLSTAHNLGNLNGSQTISGGSYRASGISLNGANKTIIVTGDVVLYVNGDVDISGNNSGIQINSGASLTVYVEGSVGIAGNGVVNNSVSPSDNEWFGLANSTSWSITGNGQWIGTIYAPDATVSFKGGGNAGDASGAVVADTIKLTGNARFHYDENLRASDTGAGYSVASWQELRNVGGSWVP